MMLRARFRLRPLGLALSLALAYPCVQALPQGAQVVQGQVQLSTPQPGQGLIQQGSDKAIINWQSFSIAAHESLRIQQPGASSVLLNRVVGGDPSLILGRMQSNGQVFLVNPRGIVFGRGSQVDAGGLVASTLDLSDSAFLAGNYRFSAGPGAGGLQADGSITATDGTVALLAPQLDVGGSITARRVGLAAGSSVTVDVEGDGLVLFNLRNDDGLDVALKFSGQVLAEGGSAELRAQARGDAAGQVLNMDGVVQARGLRQQGGRIVIDGGTAGDTWVRGSLDATGEAKGGDIAVLGQRVALLDGASLDASGRLGGGSLQVGGGFEGQGAAHNAQRTWIATGARLRADALDEGGGGQIAIWADLRTDVYGQISARGGRLGGNGGFVETSGKQQLNMPTGSVDVSAPRGRAGRWLLDPANLTISAAADSDVAATASPFQPTADTWVLNVNTLNAALAAGTGVTVRTDASVGTAGETGAIVVDAAIQGSAGGSLTLDAVGAISFTGAGSITATGSALNVSLQAGGGITGNTINTNGGTLTATSSGAGTIDLGSVTSGALTINSGGGAVVLPTGNVTGALGVSTSGGHISQRTGTLTVTGATTLGTGAGNVVLGTLNSAGLGITTTSGAITLGSGNIGGALTATSTSGAIDQALGSLTVTGATTLSTGVAAITLGSFDSAGLDATTANGIITLGTGSITGTLEATSGGALIKQAAGGLTVDGIATLNAGAGDITLNLANTLKDTVNLTGATTQVSNAGAQALKLGTLSTGALTATTGTGTLTLGTGSVGALTATTGGGDIVKSSGTLTASGAATLDAGGGSVTLNSLNAASLGITSTAGAIQLGSGNITGALTAGTGGTAAITQASGLLTVGGATTLTTASGAITLDGFDGAALTATSSGGVITLGTGRLTGALDATSGGALITQAAGGLTVDGIATLNAGAGDITLNLANTLKDTVTLTGGVTQVSNTGAQALTLGVLSTGALTATTGTGTLTLGTGNVGALTATTGGGDIVKSSGTLTASGAATLDAGAGSVTLNSLNAASLGITSTAGAIQLGTGNITGTLTAGTGGTAAITQASGLLTVGGTTTLTTASGAITLDGFDGAALTATSSGGVITLGTGTLTGALNATSGGALIKQAAGGLTVDGIATLNAGAGDITLNLANTLKDTVTLTGAVTQIRNGGSQDLTLGTLNTGNLTATTDTGKLTLAGGNVGALSATTAGGAIEQTGALSASGSATVNAGAGSVTLSDLSADSLTVTSTAAAIQLGKGDIANALTAGTLGSGAITQASGRLSVGGSTTLSTASGAITLGRFDGADLTLTSTSGALTLGNGVLSAALVATTGGTGTITQASGSLSVTGSAALTSASGAITLDSFGSGSFTGTTAGGGLRLGTGTIATTLNASTSGGEITQAAGGLTVNGIATIDAGAGNITLNLANTLKDTVHLTGGVTKISNAGSQQLKLGTLDTADLTATTGTGTLTLGTGTIDGTLSATSSGALITQAAGGLTVTGNASIHAGSADISLKEAANDWRGTVALTGDATEITSTASSASVLNLSTLNTGNLTASTAGGQLTLGTGTVNGTLDANSANGRLTQASGGLTVSGAATLAAGTGNIVLDDAANQWNGVTVSGNSLNLASAGNLDILGLTQPANRELKLSSGGNLSLGAMTDIDTGSADLSLTSGGTFTAAGKLSGFNIALAAGTGLRLDDDITATGTLGLKTTSGGILQKAGKTILADGVTTVDAGTSAISLNEATNHFDNVVHLKGGTVALKDNAALTLGTLDTVNLTVTSVGDLNLGNGKVTGTLNANSGGNHAITQTTGGLRLSGATTLNAGTADITLMDTANELGGAITATGGAVSLHSADTLHLFSLTQPTNKALVLEAVNALTLPAGTGNINTGNEALTLSTQTGVFTTFGTLAGGNITLRGQSATLAHNITALGTLLIETSSGAINQTGGRISVAGTSRFDAGTDGITLTRALNDFQSAVSLRGGAASITDQNALTLDGMTVTGLQAQAGGTLHLGTGTLTGNLGVTASGPITQATGGLRVGGTASFNAGSGAITLLETTNHFTGALSLSGGATQVRDSGAVLLGGGSVASLALTSGAVSQNAGLTVTSGLNVNAGSAAVTLNHSANQLGGTVTLTGGTTQLRTTGALTLGTLATGALTLQSSGVLNLGQGSIGGNLDATSGGGAVMQAGVLNVTGTTSIQAGGGSITLTQGSNSWGGTLSLSGGNTQVSSNGGLTLGTLAVGRLALDVGGSLNLGQGSVGGDLTVNSHGGAISQSGALDVAGAANLQGGSITLTQGGNRWGGAVQLSSGATQITGSGALTLGTLATGDLGVTSSGALNLGQGRVGGDLTASSGGSAITQSGALEVNGAATLDAGGGDITLANTGNQLHGTLSLTGNAVTLFNQPSLVLGSLSFNTLDATSNGSITLGSGRLRGALTARALGGVITQLAGGLTVDGNATLQASGGITLNSAANQFQGLVNVSGGATTLHNAGALRLGTVATAGLTLNVADALNLGAGNVGGALTATSTGAITQTGALTVSGAATLDAGSAAITLDQAANAFRGALSLRGGTALVRNGGALSLGSLRLAELTVSSSGGLQLGTGSIAGALKADSNGAAITQAAGGLVVGGMTTLEAGSAAITLTDAANAFTGQVHVRGGNVGLATSGALRLGSFTAQQLSLDAGGDIELGAGSVAGDLTARTRGSRIGQSGVLNVSGTAGFIADGGLVSLVLDQPGNQLLGPIQMRGINGGSFVSANISSALDLSFSGDVQTLKLSSGGQLTLGGGSSTTLSAAAVRGIRQTGPLQVSGLTTLIANGAAMPVALDHAGNDLARVELKSQGGGSLGRVQLRDGDAARLDGLQVAGDAGSLEVASAGALTLAGGRYGSLAADTAATGAAITQTDALAVTGLTTLRAGSGSIALTHADNSLPDIAVGSAGVASLFSAGDYTLRASQVSTQLALAGPGAIRLDGPLSGTGELVMNGSGSLTLQTAQSYTGGTRIRSGMLVLQGPAAQAGSGAVQLGAAGRLDLRDGARLTTELVVQGGVVQNSAGSATLAGPVTLQADLAVLTRAPAVLARSLASSTAEGLTISGPIADGGAGWGLTLDGGGTLALTSANQYSGSTQIAAGTLRADAAGALPSTSAVQLAAGARLVLGADQTAGSLSGAGAVELDRYTLTTGTDGSDTAFSGSLSGTGGLTKTGSGRFTLAGSGTHDGATRVAGGELVLASANGLNERTAVTVDAGATLTVQQAQNLGSLAGSGTVDVQAAQLGVGSNGASTRFDGRLTGTGGLAKLGSGSFTLAGRHALAGDVQVAAGRLQLEGEGVLPAATGVRVAGGATLALLADQALGALDGSGQVLLDSHTLTLGASGRSSRFDGVISGSGSLVKQGSGTLGLGGANLYTGSTRVDAGTLALHTAQALHGPSTLAIAAAAQVDAKADQAVASLAGSGSLVLDGARFAVGAGGADSRFDGVASGSGSLVKQGSGTLTLTAAQRNSGATDIEAGSLVLTAAGSLGAGEIRNQGRLRLERDDALTLDQAITGAGSLTVVRGQVTLTNAANAWRGTTEVLGGSLITSGAERLPDASRVAVAAGAQLQLGGNETIAALQAAGSVRLAGHLSTQAEQVYTGSLTLANAAGITLSGTRIDASASTNQFDGTPLGLNAGQAFITVKDGLKLGDVTLSGGGRIEAQRLQLDGALKLSGGSLSLVATAAPDDAKATPQGTAQVPLAGLAMVVAEATVQQGASGAITVDEGAKLQVHASGGGSVLLGQDANDFKGQLAVLSGANYNTAWAPNAKGAMAVQSLVRVSGKQVLVGGDGIEADLVSLRADKLGTADSAQIAARLPFDEIVLGRALSAPGLTLELAPGAFAAGSFGTINGQPVRIAVGSTETGARTVGPNAGYLTVLPKGGAQGATVVVLTGPKVGSQPSTGGPAYRFFHDGASQATEVPVIYNGVLPLTPSASGALSSINGDAEDARRARFQETVRTENVTVRLRSGVIAEVGPGRPSTQGSEGAAPPVQCDPAAQPVLSCK